MPFKTLSAVATLALLSACAATTPGDAFFTAVRSYNVALKTVVHACVDVRTLDEATCRRAAAADLEVQRALVAAQLLLVDPEASPADIENALDAVERALVAFLAYQARTEEQ